MQVVDVGISISLMNYKLTDFSALSLKFLLFIAYISMLPNHINNEVNKCNPEKNVSLWDQSLMTTTSNHYYFSLGLQLLIKTLQLASHVMKTKKHSSLDS